MKNYITPSSLMQPVPYSKNNYDHPNKIFVVYAYAGIKSAIVSGNQLHLVHSDHSFFSFFQGRSDDPIET